MLWGYLGKCVRKALGIASGDAMGNGSGNTPGNALENTLGKTFGNALANALGITWGNVSENVPRVFCKLKWKKISLIIGSFNVLSNFLILINNEKSITKKVEVTNTLNNFFSNIIKNLKIPEYYVEQNHPRINIVKKFLFQVFTFRKLISDTALEEIRKLNLNKAVQDTDDPVRILKENTILLSTYVFNLTKQYVHQNFQHSSNLLTEHQYLNIVPVINYRRISIISKYLKSLFVDNFQIILLIFFRNSSVVLEIAIVHSNVSLPW